MDDGVISLSLSHLFFILNSTEIIYFQRNVFLGAFAKKKCKKATISFVMSVCLSARPLPLDGFSRNLKFFKNMSKNIEV